MAFITGFNEMGIDATLPEYNDAPGMILMSQVTRQRKYYVRNLLRLGTLEVVSVMNVDPDRNFIDLSRAEVTSDARQVTKERFARSKVVHMLMRQFASDLQCTDLESLYQKYAWPLIPPAGRFPSIYDAFCTAVASPQTVWTPEMRKTLGIEDKDIETLHKIISRKLTPPVLKFRAEAEVSCFEYEGIDAIKRALQAGVDAVPKMTVKLVATPLFVFFYEEMDLEKGLAALNKGLAAIEVEIRKAGGDFKITSKPAPVHDAHSHVSSVLTPEKDDSEEEEEEEEEEEDVDEEDVDAVDEDDEDAEDE